MAFEPHDRTEQIVLERLDGVSRDVLWLGTAMAATGLVYATYLAVHEYPAYGGGLFLEMASLIVHNGYDLPEAITRYAGGRIPFAYPPLMAYVVGLSIDLFGVPPLAISLYLPGLVTIGYLLPYYGIARELTGSPDRAGLATLLVGVTPAVLRWHLSAGGLVRAPAFLFALSGIYAGVKLFRTHDRRWLLAAVATFALTVLTHPTYTVFFVLSFLLLYAGLDRTPRGLVYGGIVGVGGVLIAAPWWTHVTSTYGFDVFFAAAGTHGGIGGGFDRLVEQLTYRLNDLDVEWPFYVAASLGVVYALANRRLLLPAWAIAASYLIGKNRFLFVAGSILVAVFVYETIVPWIRNRARTPERRRAAPRAVVVVIAVSAVLAGVVYGAGMASAANGYSPSQPSFIDDADRDAMRWMELATDPSARFVVLGDAAEWVPFLTDRSILVGPWGVEWVSPAAYDAHRELYKAVSACPDAPCLTRTLAHAGVHPDYVYVPKGTFTVRGDRRVQADGMVASLSASERYRIAFENEGVVIVRVVNEGTGTHDATIDGDGTVADDRTRTSPYP